MTDRLTIDLPPGGILIAPAGGGLQNVSGGRGSLSVPSGADAGYQLFKGREERRYTLGLAYGANLPDVGKAADGFQDFVSAEVLEDAAWSFMKKGGNIGLHHQDGTDGRGVVVESYIWPADDWPQANGYVVQKGDWLLGVVWDKPTWGLIKSGQVQGYSPQGGARRRAPSAESLAGLRR